MTTPYTPTDEQRAVIDSTNPVLVVLGGAGTGKTTTAAAAARAHLERSSPQATSGPTRHLDVRHHPRVLFLSFSRASVARITERNRPILGSYRHHVDVTTFHALAWRFILRFGALIDLPNPHLTSNAEALLLPSADNLRYHDLVPNALSLLEIPAIANHARSRWSMIICDEFQDTDDRQYALLQAIKGDARLLLMGDPNQCIYANLPGAIGVKPERLYDALDLPGAMRIDLPEARTEIRRASFQP